MKQETNKEMDLLLRRLGRRDETSVSEAAGSHLDADELGAYAENALPAAARARYTAHLADCSRCRELVVQLSSSIGVVAAAETTKAPSTWRTFLATLLTPMVLRYAAPALGLIVVAAIGFMILRRDQPDRYVTQVTNDEQRPAAVPSAEDRKTFNGSINKPTPSPDELVDKQAKNQKTAEPASPPNAPPSVVSVQTEVSKDTAVATGKTEQQQPASANEPPSPKPVSSTTPEASPGTADSEVKKREVREVPAAAPTTQTALQAETEGRKDDFVRRPGNRGVPSDAVSAQRAGGIAKLQRDEGNLSANTRTVAGRRFQKKGGVWIDTAYDSSKDSVTLSRGSEQYRALVADEPAIKTIADELNGEIIVVWKGHTYRIR